MGLLFTFCGKDPVFEQGFEKPVAALIWPKLNRVIAAGTGGLAVYTAEIISI